jgi:hypothetical protein
MKFNESGQGIQAAIFKNSTEKIKQDLERVDFDLIRGVFEEIYSKAGLDPKEMDFITKEDIEFFYDMTYAAACAGGEEVLDEVTGEEVGLRPTLRFNPANYKFIVPGLDKETKKLLVLKLLIHEQVHTTHPVYAQEFRDREGVQFFEKVSGLQAFDSNIDTTLKAFNEGLVEKIADKVLVEYLKRSGQSSHLLEEHYKVYDIGRMLVDILIEKISAYAGVPEDQVFNALVGASYDGQDILDDDIFADGGNEIQSFIQEHAYTAPHSVNVPFRNSISAKEKKELVALFSREIDIEKYTDTYVLRFLKKYGVHKAGEIENREDFTV